MKRRVFLFIPKSLNQQTNNKKKKKHLLYDDFDCKL